VRHLIPALVFSLTAIFSLQTPSHALSPSMITERSDHFIVSAACDAQTRKILIGHLETFHSVLNVLVPSVTGIGLSDAPIGVLLYEDAGDYHAHVRQHAPGLGHNGGYYDGHARRVVSHRRANPLQLQFHEIAHAALGDVFDDPTHQRYARPGWPVWFDEGFAEYVSSFEVVPEGLKFGAPHLARIATLVSAIESHQTISLSALLKARSRSFTGKDMDLWYATSWGLVDLLLSEPDLRRRVPRWIAKLRAGDDGLIAFRDVFGADLRALEHRFHRRVRRLGSQRREVRPLAPRGKIEHWTAHDGGRWWSEGGQILGQSEHAWSYLTTPLPLSRNYQVDLDLHASSGSRLGLVLGRHHVGGYPYHTILSFDGQQVSVREVKSADEVKTLVSRPFALPTSSWSSLKLSVERGVLVVRIDGQDMLATRLAKPSLSLLGLYVERGAARFRDPIFSSAAHYPAGPKAIEPPGGIRYGP